MIYDSFDIQWGLTGDLVIKEGDIGITDESPLQAIIQHIKMRVENQAGDWRDRPGLGIPFDILGAPNEPEVVEAWDAAIKSTLITDELVLEEDLLVESAPVAVDEIITLINLETTPTQENGMTTSVSTFVISRHGRKPRAYT